MEISKPKNVVKPEILGCAHCGGQYPIYGLVYDKRTLATRTRQKQPLGVKIQCLQCGVMVEQEISEHVPATVARDIVLELWNRRSTDVF